MSQIDQRSHQTIEAVAESLEHDKLRLEIAELKKPFYRRPGNWFSFIAAVVAVGGFFGQSLLSNLKVERALLEAAQKQDEAAKRIGTAEGREAEAATRQAAAEKARTEAEAKTRRMQSELVALESDKRALDAQIDSAREGLNRLSGLIDQLKAAVPESLIASIEKEIAGTADSLLRECSGTDAAAYDRALFLDEQQVKTTLVEHLPWGVPEHLNGSESVPNLVQAWWVGSYDPTVKVPRWIAYRLDGPNIKSAKRVDCVRPDPRFKPDEQATEKDYREPVYDRGNLVPRADMTRSDAAAASTFIFTSIAPQMPVLNRESWNKLEEAGRRWAMAYDTVFVMAGPVFDYDQDGKGDPPGAAPTIGEGKVVIPSHFFRIVVRADSEGPTHMAGFLMSNNDEGPTSYRTSVVSIDTIEAMTGFDFFPDLDGAKFEQLECQ